MTKTILLFGACLALLLVGLKWMEYQFFAKDLSMELFMGVIGLVCITLGAWVGWHLTRPKADKSLDQAETKPAPEVEEAYPNDNRFGLSPREYEVLVMIAGGYSYQEIADKLFVSLSTVKTHSANIFSKMDVRRRTQAVMLAQQAGLLPPAKV